MVAKAYQPESQERIKAAIRGIERTLELRALTGPVGEPNEELLLNAISQQRDLLNWVLGNPRPECARALETYIAAGNLPGYDPMLVKLKKAVAK